MKADAKYPEMIVVNQIFVNNPLTNPTRYLEEKLVTLNLSSRISKGQSVAITAGSRGITDIVPVIRTLVNVFKTIGAKPFVIPAMGSHGGATDEGQAAILHSYNITETSVGAPVRSSMKTEFLGETRYGVPVYMDANAFGADHVVVLNRVKPHTDFEGEIESGLTKMMSIGLGKREGAETYHNAILDQGYCRTFTSVADVVVEKGPITLGVGIVENQVDQTEEIGVAWVEDIPALDRQLLRKAKAVFARLPFDRIDLLIVDEMGKDISGTGMDQNIIARTAIKVGTVPALPNIRRIFVRDLTPASHGTATGLANADFSLTRLVNKIDRHNTYTNCFCSCEPAMAAIPPYFDTDREAIDAAFATIGLKPADRAWVVHIQNTLQLSTFTVSKALLEEGGDRNDCLFPVGEKGPLTFDKNGFLILPWE